MSGSRVAQISVPSDSHSIAIARRFVSQILADLAWVTPAMVDDVRLVASELVTNAVRAQRRVNDSATIAIRAAGFDDRFELTVVDHGGGFEVDTSALRLPDAHIDREGGFGLPLISALTDEIHVVSAADGAEVRVVVYRDRASAPTRSA